MTSENRKNNIEEIVCVMPEYRKELLIKLIMVLSQATDRTIELSIKMAESIVRNEK